MYRDWFNYGAEVTTDDNLIIWPSTGRRTAILDSDMFPYIVGYTTDDLKYLKAKAKVSSGAASSITDTSEFKDAADHMNFLINRWVVRSGCDSARGYLTNSKKNYRVNIAIRKPYKGQRKTEKPPFFRELREYLIKVHGHTLSNGNEADDWMSIEQYLSAERLEVELGSVEHRALHDIVVCTKDKDDAIAYGMHWNPDTEEFTWTDDSIGSLIPKWKKNSVATKDYAYIGTGQFWTRGDKAGQEKMKRICTGSSKKMVLHKLSGTGLMFFYAQLIMGDTADNYDGVEGKGKAFAYELLKDCKTEKELFFAVLQTYKDVYANGYNSPVPIKNYRGGVMMLTPYQLMLESGRLAWMQSHEGELWRARDFCPLGGDDAQVQTL